MSDTTSHARADAAARTVDPLLLAGALDHIAKTAAGSRTQTRRLRWIERRAVIALEGREYRDIDVDLPKYAGPESVENLRNRVTKLKAANTELVAALQKVIANIEASGDEWGMLAELRALVERTQT
jgi:hypothetical protein